MLDELFNKWIFVYFIVKESSDKKWKSFKNKNDFLWNKIELNLNEMESIDDYIVFYL